MYLDTLHTQTDDCAHWNYTCNKELLEDEDLVIVQAPLWYLKLSQALQGGCVLLPVYLCVQVRFLQNFMSCGKN